MRNLRANRPDIRAEQLKRTRKLMDKAVLDSLVTGHEPLVHGLSLPDDDDRHVLAAGIVARAGVIVTFNTNDFPQASLDPYGIEAQHPDDFLVYQFGLAQGAACTAIRRLRSRLKSPSMNVESYLEGLSRHQLPQFADQLRRFGNLL
jgi:hypothetical protein